MSRVLFLRVLCVYFPSPTKYVMIYYQLIICSYYAKTFLSLTVMFVFPFLCHSQANVYSSAAEKSQPDMSISHVVGNVVNLESEDGSLSTGALVQYSVAVVTGMDVEEISLLTVYPNPTKDVLVLRTGGLKGLTMTLTDARAS